LRSSGIRARQQRDIIDQAAAVELLQAALDGERATGRPPGECLDVPEGRAEPNGGTGA